MIRPCLSPVAMAASVFTLSAACPLDASAISLSPIGRYETGVFAEGAAEITAFDAGSDRLFVINADGATVDIVNLADPASPSVAATLDIQSLFGNATFAASPNSVAVNGGLVAVAVERADRRSRQKSGVVAFFRASGELVGVAEAGALPDMVTFTPDGNTVLTANEGEPSPDYSWDPQGSVTMVDVRALRSGQPLAEEAVRKVTFGKFNHRRDLLLEAGIRIYGPDASVAQDLEPEYIAVSPDSQYAYVGLQENNAVAVINLAVGTVRDLLPLGYKNWSLSALDASDRDNAISLNPWPVFGMYQPDGLACYEVGGDRYLVSANEGDARDYETFAEEARVSELTLDPVKFPDAASLQARANLGRLTVTTAMGDDDGDGDFDRLFTLGGRSFSIWKVGAGLTQVYDSGDDFERITAEAYPDDFNSNNDENDSFDSRSDNKGPEPEGLALGGIDGRTYAFLGLERIGGVMVYDITDPVAPAFVQYLNTRDFSGEAEAGTAGDLGPEGVEFVSAADSPNGKPLLIVAHEISGSVAIFQID